MSDLARPETQTDNDKLPPATMFESQIEDDDQSVVDWNPEDIQLHLGADGPLDFRYQYDDWEVELDNA